MRTQAINERRQPGYFPYYKLQWWADDVMAWKDIQKRFGTQAEAAAMVPHLVPQGTQHRLMKVERTGRIPVP